MWLRLPGVFADCARSSSGGTKVDEGYSSALLRRMFAAVLSFFSGLLGGDFRCSVPVNQFESVVFILELLIRIGLIVVPVSVWS